MSSIVMDLPFQLDRVYLQDCITGMKHLPDRCVDIAIADPPYNASKGGKWSWDNAVELPGFGGNWSKVMENWDSMPLSDYVQFTVAWLKELKRVVKPTGSMWIHGTYHNIGIINFLMQALGIEIINEVIWYKRNSFPNLAGRRLTASHETILWAHAGKKRDYLFNYSASKEMPCIGDNLKMPGKQMRTVWDIPNNKRREELEFGKHPTQKPVQLITRMMELSAKPKWVCLVPFAGAGSDCIAAKRLGMHFLAFETDRKYYEIANKRLNADATLPLFPVYKQTTSRPSQTTGNRKVQTSQRERHSIPSLIKWSGSKRSQAFQIRKLLPEYERYCEPFLGGGALLYLAAKPGAVAGDIYAPLVELWRAVQRNPIVVAENYSDQWRRLQMNLPDYYYEVRDRFNRDKDPLDLNFLMRTCVNGIIRFNESLLFNNSFHLSRKGMTPERFAATVETWSERIRGVTFLCQDYESTVMEMHSDDFVYLDPPYAGNNQRYTADLDLSRFFGVLGSLNRKDVKWALSFDGSRGSRDLTHPIPLELYKRKLLLTSGNSAVGKVLNGPLETVRESLYMNYV